MRSAVRHSASTTAAPETNALQLGCLAASPRSVKAAIEAGADWVRIPFRLRQSSLHELKAGRLADTIRYAHARRRKLVLDLGLSSLELTSALRRSAVSWAADQGFDAIALSDFGMSLYCAIHHPHLPLHFVAPGNVCARTVKLMKLQVNAARILIPPTVSPASLIEISEGADVALEILTCDSRPRAPAVELAGTDTGPVSGGACNDSSYSAEKNLSATLRQLPLLASLGVRTVHVEARVDAPCEVANVAHVWRTAIDRCLQDGRHYAVDPSWCRKLGTAPAAQ